MNHWIQTNNMLTLTLTESSPIVKGSFKRFNSNQSTIILGRGPRDTTIVTNESSGLFRRPGTQVMSRKHARITWKRATLTNPPPPPADIDAEEDEDDVSVVSLSRGGSVEVEGAKEYPCLEDLNSTNGTSLSRGKELIICRGGIPYRVESPPIVILLLYDWP